MNLRQSNNLIKINLEDPDMKTNSNFENLYDSSIINLRFVYWIWLLVELLQESITDKLNLNQNSKINLAVSTKEIKNECEKIE